MNSIFAFFWKLSHGRYGLKNTFWIFGIALMQGLIPHFIGLVTNNWGLYNVHAEVTMVATVIFVTIIAIFYLCTLSGIWVGSSRKNSPNVHFIWLALSKAYVLTVLFALIMKTGLFR